MSSKGSDSNEMFCFIIGGVTYSLLLSDIIVHKDCYFARAVKDVWSHGQQAIIINRDGVLFQHIFGYIYICRYGLPFAVEGPLELMIGVRREADYYNFPELVALYDNACKEALQNWCKTYSLSSLLDLYTVSTTSAVGSDLEELVNTELYPGRHSGTLYVTECQPTVSEYTRVAKQLFRFPPHAGIIQMDWPKLSPLLEHVKEVLPTLPGVACLFTDGLVYGLQQNDCSPSTSKGVTCPNRVGTIVYILNSPYTGGVITVSRNGVSSCITKPGEYIMYTSEYTRDISTVTTGALMFAMFSIVRKDPILLGSIVRVPKFTPHSTFPSQSTLLQAVYSELGETKHDGGSCVVLCLSRLYPIIEFDPVGPYLETDPDSLADRDAMLYNCLKDTFEVTLVTVWVQRSSGNSKGCIVGPQPTTSTLSTKIKIVTPFHGFTEAFLVNSTMEDSENWIATLYTAMYITVR